MQTYLTFILLNSVGQGHLVTFAKDHLVRIFWEYFLFGTTRPGCIANHYLLSLYVYKRSVSSYIKQISHCSLSAQGSDQDLMVLLFFFFVFFLFFIIFIQHIKSIHVYKTFDLI